MFSSETFAAHPLHWAVASQNIGRVEALLRTSPHLVRQQCRLGSMAYEPIDLLHKFRFLKEELDVEKAKAIAAALIKYGATIHTEVGVLNAMLNTEAPDELFEYIIHISDARSQLEALEETLFLAIIHRHTAAITCLLKLGVNPNAPATSFSQSAYTISPTLPLHEVITWGNWDMVHMLLQHGADPFAADAYGLTALQWAQHVVTSLQCKPESLGILSLFQHLFAGRAWHEQHKHALHKDLVEHIFHPTRLLKLGVFEDLD